MLPLGITMGDAAGIGPEIIIKTLASGRYAPESLLIYGDEAILKSTAKRLGYSDLFIPIRHCGFSLGEIKLGEIQAQAGKGAFLYLKTAIEDALSGKIKGITTAPLHKVSLKLAGYDYPGHTEILAELTHSPDVAMMLLNDEIRTLLATIHVPLSQVPALITRPSQERLIHLAHQVCLQLGISHPRIAIAGLNPHAGEEGRFGTEEQNIIIPAIQHMQSRGLQVSGPYPSDTVFMRARKGEFDIVIAQYHDQGLIPVKYLGLDKGVNVTVGLPIIRTSVDHGTAFDIAGQGIADPESLMTAIDVALNMEKI
ncbi:4-hydroxythreonine-4-phosphate dehydrogenase [Basilea psittacipulmonis DSM 24701]|uniref:4-hydroxythreonine-4-phosphate dehydrogenase n=2 Tax=Basilea TaxID=1472344 RepID=A0A077DJ70_9BURK|nr:4-hydroxythreonine-4-phosphate dehydrogenase [Basilea psittacipulmonis DSM 24701]